MEIIKKLKFGKTSRSAASFGVLSAASYKSRLLLLWCLIALCAAITFFVLGRYSIALSTAPTASSGRRTYSDKTAAAADTAASCAHPLDMYDNEGIDDASGDGATERFLSRQHAALEEDITAVFEGVRHFVAKCLVQGSERLEVVAKSKLKSGDKKKRIVDHETVAFLVRDVCALGHFPKDLAHMHSWQQRQAAVSSAAGLLAEEIVIAGEDAEGKRAELLRAPMWKAELNGKSVEALVVGHRCATRDPKRVFNKRTPVFHDVLVHWVRALSCQYGLLLPQGSGSIEHGNCTHATSVTLFEDYDDTVHCYSHILEREERWRWFPTYDAAHSFRQKMWAYLGVDYAAVHEQRHRVPFDKQPKLQIVVLHRDEDRHFDELRVVDFLRAKFSSVADIRYEQYDTPPNKKKITRENNSTLPLHRDQLLQLYHTDILIAAHGAALSNIVVMQPGAVVVELFPHNFRYYMYEELARIMSLTYVAYESEEVYPAGCCKKKSWAASEDDGKTATGFQSPAASIAAIFGLNGKRDCKKCSILVREEQWYQIVKNAMASVWLRNSRLSNVHDFDVRR